MLYRNTTQSTRKSQGNIQLSAVCYVLAPRNRFHVLWLLTGVWGFTWTH